MKKEQGEISPAPGLTYTNLRLKPATERIGFFDLAKLSEGRRSSATLTGAWLAAETKQRLTGKVGARIAVF